MVLRKCSRPERQASHFSMESGQGLTTSSGSTQNSSLAPYKPLAYAAQNGLRQLQLTRILFHLVLVSVERKSPGQHWREVMRKFASRKTAGLNSFSPAEQPVRRK